MIQIGTGNKLKNIKVTYQGASFDLNPDTDEQILRRVIGELSTGIDNHSICIPEDMPKWALYSIAVQFSHILVQKTYEQRRNL